MTTKTKKKYGHLSKKDKVYLDNFVKSVTSKKDDITLVNELMKHLKDTYKNESTLSYKMSAYKRYVRERNVLDDLTLDLISDRELRIKLNKANEERELPDKTNLDVNVLGRILEFKESSNVSKLLIYLLLATGRRIVEFLEGEWSIRDDKLYINKLSKKRGVVQEEGYHIKLISDTDPKEFMQLLKKFNELNTKPTPMANRKAIARILKKPEYSPLKSSSDLRTLYIQYLKDNDPEVRNQHGNQAIKKLLHHEKRTTSVFYNDKYQIVEPIEEYSEESLKKKNKKELREILNKRNYNKNNTLRFNRLRREELLKIILENKIKPRKI